MGNIFVNNDKIETYKAWAETIHQNILDSFAYYGYLQGLDEFFKSYKYKDKLSIACMEFIKRQKYLFQIAICLNIAKLLFDKGPDVYSFDNYKHIIEGYKGERLNIKKLKIDKNLAETIIGFRKNYIAHSIADADAISVKMSDLFEVLKLEVSYFNAITDDAIYEQCYRFDDNAIEIWVNSCATGINDFIAMNKNNYTSSI
jgi:hypothetical protein